MDMQLLNEAVEKSEVFYSKIPFEVHWDFASLNQLERENLEFLVKDSYMRGYLDGRQK